MLKSDVMHGVCPATKLQICSSKRAVWDKAEAVSEQRMLCAVDPWPGAAAHRWHRMLRESSKSAQVGDRRGLSAPRGDDRCLPCSRAHS